MNRLIALFLVLSGPLYAGADEQEDVLTCISGVGASTTWNQCLGQIFAPCEGMEVGSEPQIACLQEQRESWRIVLRSSQEAVMDKLTRKGADELVELMHAWPPFVRDKCNAIAESRAAISEDAAKLGCNISEVVLLTSEFRACLDGRSTETYCDLKE